MKTIISFLALFVALALVGCGDNTEAEAVDALTPAVDAGPAADACVMGRGNCGCIVYTGISYVTNQTTVTVVCPDAGK